MKREEERREKDNDPRAKLIFTGVIVAFALVLFLTSDKGRAIFGGAYTASVPEAANDEVSGDSALSETEFLRGIEERIECECEFIASDSDGKHYMLSYEAASDIELITYVSERGLDGICLRWVCAKGPEEISEDATAIERDIYDRACEAYSVEVSNFHETLEASLNSLTINGGAAKSEIEEMLLTAEDTARTGKRASLRTKGLDYTSGVYDENGIKLLVISISFIEK